jgi:hypothetical protein
MTVSKLTLSSRLRAAGAVMALLLGWLSAPVALAARTPDEVCSMTCCVEDGHCCCTPALPYVKGQLPNDRDKIGSAQLSAPCPEGCAPSNSLSNSFFRNSTPAAGNYSVRAESDVLATAHKAIEWDSIYLILTSPRAPPAHFPNLTA